VKGFFDLFSILVYVAIGIALFVSKKIYRTLQWLVALFFLGTLVRFVWLVIGACMYWGYLWPSNLCKPAVDAYMWIMLLFNMIIQFIGQCIVLAFLWRFMAASSDVTEYEDAKPKGTVTEGPFELKVQ
jgi:thiamine transporter ThiT